MKRREFLKRSALGIGGVLALRLAPAAETPATNAAAVASTAAGFDPYETVALGRTGLKASRFCLGTGMNGANRASNHTRLGREKLTALIRGAYDRGTRMFDTADLYGTHTYFGPALRGIRREQYVIATKVWWARGSLPESERPDADAVIARFLRELQTEYIDIVLLHCVIAGNWPETLRKQMDLLAGLKQKGTVRAVGVSCHSLRALEAAASEPWVDVVHARINPFGIAMDGAPEEVLPVLKRLRAAGKAVVGMKLVGAGQLRRDPERRNESIRFVLKSGCVDVLNVGCESLEEVDDFAGRVRKVR